MADTDRIEETRGAEVIPFPSRPPASEESGDEVRLADALGAVLRDERHRQHRTLADVAEHAAVSLPYLSEVERGRKEVSSDLLAAITGALEIELVEVLERVVGHLRAGSSSNGPQLRAA